MTDAVRTPDELTDGLPDFPFASQYRDVDGLRMAHIDEGDGAPVVFFHGEPTWSFLWRKVIPPVRDAGFRCIAPDLPGFGRSDKPAQRADYTYARHVAWMHSFLQGLDLRDVVLVGQDWGGLIGLRLVAEDPDRFAAVVAANTFLPRGEPAGEAFLRWQQFSQTVPELPVGGIIQGATTTDLTPDVIAAYDAPFPDESYKEGARQFPVLVPTSPDDPASGPTRRAWEQLSKFDKPFLCAFSDSDPITAGADRVLKKDVPGAEGQPHTVITGGGHFLQEDKGEELARVVVEFVEQTRG
jgi:haloalkane dehalogenase